MNIQRLRERNLKRLKERDEAESKQRKEAKDRKYKTWDEMLLERLKVRHKPIVVKLTSTELFYNKVAEQNSTARTIMERMVRLNKEWD